MGVPNGNQPVNGHASSNAAKYNLPSHFIGGNHLDVAPPSTVKDFVANHGGHSVITSVSLRRNEQESGD
jgi:acetyl-CoA carboxylase/biotin carboxylase 1